MPFSTSKFEIGVIYKWVAQDFQLNDAYIPVAWLNVLQKKTLSTLKTCQEST